MFVRTGWLSAALISLPALALAQADGGRGAAAAPQLPEGPGREVVQRVCTSCHPVQTLLMKRDGEGGWRHTATRMALQRQAQLLPEEFETVVRYLSTRLGPGLEPMQTGKLPPGAMGGGATQAKDVKLPDGPGRDETAARCALCHDLGRVVSIRRTKEEWDYLARNMLGRGPQATEAQIQSISSYLSSHFLEEQQ